MSDPLTEFDYLLNAMERASRAKNPAELQYAAKRRCVIDYVRKLEALSKAPVSAEPAGWRLVPIEPTPRCGKLRAKHVLKTAR